MLINCFVNTSASLFAAGILWIFNILMSTGTLAEEDKETELAASYKCIHPQVLFFTEHSTISQVSFLCQAQERTPGHFQHSLGTQKPSKQLFHEALLRQAQALAVLEME